MSKNRVAGVTLDGESLPVVQHRFEVNGWNYTGIGQNYMNAAPRHFFEKPEDAPDNQPFAEPNLKSS